MSTNDRGRCERAPLALVVLVALGMVPLGAQERQFGGKYSGLDGRQQELVRLWAAEASKIFGHPADAETLYNKLPLSTRTTFEAVTHALAHSQLTSGSGRSYGTALDLVEMVERVAGQVPGSRGDSQYRVYVYLKPGAVDKLYNSREFKRVHDNTVFHIGYPLNFRQQGGAPSIQFSVAQTGRRADIDVDYRPSGGVNALVSGHLTAANSDVRAGNNHERHIGRWRGFSDWWRGLMATLLNPNDALELADFTPDSHPELQRAAHGPLPEMLHTYLEEWLIHQRPAGLLSSVSIKAYPCVAEFKDGSRPDSKLALVRILKQMQDVNQRLGTVKRLEDALIPVAYPLPDAEPIRHSFQSLFSLQHIHEDTAWAIDCRVRYGLNLVESIPRPAHDLEDSYVASFRLNEKGAPGFLIQTWRRESGLWRLVSFDIKRTHLSPPADLLTLGALPPGWKPVEPGLRTAVEAFLSNWLIEHQLDFAVAAFLPEAAACDPLGGADAASSTLTNTNIQEFLRRTAEVASKGHRLSQVISAAQTGHPELTPLAHEQQGAYLLAEASAALVAGNVCQSSDMRATAAKGTDPGAFLAFHFSHSRQESAGVLSFYWKRVNNEWRISSYSLSAD